MKFILILSWMFSVIFLLRLIGIFFGKRTSSEKEAIRYLEKFGYTPYYDAAKVPFIGFCICLAYLIYYYI